MKLFSVICYLLIISTGFSQGITLLYKGGGFQGNWNDATSWVQINTPSGQVPIQRAPTELDDVVFSKSLSGLSGGSFGFPNYSDSVVVGGDGSALYKCRSMHVSNFELRLENSTHYSLYIRIYTKNGGNVKIDSSSRVPFGRFILFGGDAQITDLVIENSDFGGLFSHQHGSTITIEAEGKGKFIHSVLGGQFWTKDGGARFIAQDCTIRTSRFSLGAGGYDTLIRCKFENDAFNNHMGFSIGPNAHFVSEQVDVSSWSTLEFCTSGSTLNGNITVINQTGTLKLEQLNPLDPLPNIINGNVTLLSGAHSMAISGDLKISGNFSNYGHELLIYPDTSHLFINGNDVMKIGGIFNYYQQTSITTCRGNYCHFTLEFFGDKPSNIAWPIGIPIDTLVVNKKNCAKLTSNNPIYVSGEARIQQGQLLLKPNSNGPYKMICAGNLVISPGGGLSLGKNAAGEVANLAVEGSLYDYNRESDTACSGFTNPYNGTVTLYRSGTNTADRFIGMFSNTSLGNLNLISENSSALVLDHELIVHDLTFTNTLNLILDIHNLIVTGDITHLPGGN